MSQLNSWCFTGARVAQGPHDATYIDLEIQAGRVHFLRSSLLHDEASSPPQLNLTGMLILPGLINAHDHLEFALFPRLSNGNYSSAREWALDIYHPDQSPIRELLQVPKRTRLFWGGLKNLLCGVTTVCQHNWYEPDVFENQFPVRVLKRFGWSHSFAFSQDVKADFKQAPAGAPRFIHLAEGTDEASRNELDQLDRLGLLNGQTVIVHGVALTSQDWELVRQRGSRLVWCPSSNLFTLGKTVDLALMPSGLELALGNDSPLTAAGDLLDEIRFAYATRIGPENPLLGGVKGVSLQGWVPSTNSNPPLHPSGGGEFASANPTHDIDPAARLYPMVTTSAAHAMGLNQGQGAIAEGGVADLIVVKDAGVSPNEQLVRLSSADIELVVLEGEVMLVSAQLASRIPSSLLNRMQKLLYGGKECFASLAIRPHWEATQRILGNNFRLAGKKICLVMR